MDITEFARLGGKARAASLTSERRHAIALKAGRANAKKHAALRALKRLKGKS